MTDEDRNKSENAAAPETPDTPDTNEPARGKEAARSLPTWLLIGAAALAGMLVGGGLWLFVGLGPGVKQGEVVSRPDEAAMLDIGGPFSLINQDGVRVTDETYAASYKLIYFGYTYCPDVCPLGLMFMQDVLNTMGPAAGKVQPLFITVDPDRDTPDVMKAYITSFHPRLVGLTGTPEEITAVTEAYRVYSRKAPMPGSDDPADYVMDHMSVFYFMAPDGTYLAHLLNPAQPKEAAQKLLAAMK